MTPPGAATGGGREGRAGAGQNEPTPEWLERLRRSGIRIDSAGEFQHEGEPVRHEGLRRALYRWLDRLEDGRTVLRLKRRAKAVCGASWSTVDFRQQLRDGGPSHRPNDPVRGQAGGREP